MRKHGPKSKKKRSSVTNIFDNTSIKSKAHYLQTELLMIKKNKVDEFDIYQGSWLRHMLTKRSF